MRYIVGISFSLAVAVLPSFGMWADGQDPPPPSSSSTEKTGEPRVHGDDEPPVEQPTTGDESRDHPTAKDVLDAIRRMRPENRVIPPAGTAQGPVADGGLGASSGRESVVRRDLMPEGSRIQNRSGALAYDGLWWVFVFDDEHDVPPMKVLPNDALEPMVRTLRGSDDDALRFEVSGELTVFNGENYLLPSVAMRSTDVTIAPARTPEESGDKPSEDEADDGGISPDASPEDVLTWLKDQRPSREAVRSASTDEGNGTVTESGSAGASGGNDAGAARTLIPDGSPLMERPGRVILREPWWTFVFESDHPEHPELPMKLLPCRSLGQMVEATRPGSSGLVFIVSGQVTVFENENYLLPRIARRRIDAGNLRP